MVGEPERHRRIVAEVADLYGWIDAQLKQNPAGAGSCAACGVCCDFPAYDHRLFVTPPELVYLAAKLNARHLKATPDGRCPYQQNQRCSIHEHRFAGCRIFCCKGDSAFQSELSEATLKRLKTICEHYGIAYRYQDLPATLDAFATDTCRSAGGPCPADRAG
jgi:Fe-S-cluster containining protein